MPRREGIEYAVDHPPAAPPPRGPGWFVALTNEDAKDFRVLASPDSGEPSWRELVPHRPGVRVEDVDAFDDALVLSERSEAQTQVRVLPLPGTGDPFADRPARVGLGHPLGREPVVDLARHEPRAPHHLAALRPHVDGHSVERAADPSRRSPGDAAQAGAGPGRLRPARYRTYRVWATAPDCTWVPISVVHRSDLALPAPCLLYGYGAYEISIDPSFSHHRLSLLDRGMVFAIAHVRGGGEMGRAWYEDGRMEHKENTFSDFIACARHLVDAGIARPGALAGRGGSAGGLLIGAVANQAPEVFRALVAEVPFVDCVTTMLDDELPLTVGEWEEWGNPAADEAAYWRMLTYSPYDNVTGENLDGTRRTYPDLFVTAGLNDPRVAYWEPAKWVAKFRERLALDACPFANRAGCGSRRTVGPLRLLAGGSPGLRLSAGRPRPG